MEIYKINCCSIVDSYSTKKIPGIYKVSITLRHLNIIHNSIKRKPSGEVAFVFTNEYDNSEQLVFKPSDLADVQILSRNIFKRYEGGTYTYLFINDDFIS